MIHNMCRWCDEDFVACLVDWIENKYKSIIPDGAIACNKSIISLLLKLW